MWEQLNGLTWDSFLAFVIDQVKNNQFFATAGFFGVLTVIWNYTKAYPEYLWDRIKRKITYTVNVYETDEFFGHLEAWLQGHRQMSYRNVEAYLYHHPRQDPEIRMKQFEDVFFLWRRFRYLKVFKGRERLENASDLKNAYLNHFQITGIFAKRAINVWMNEVLQYNLDLKRDAGESISIHTNDSHYWSMHHDIIPKPVERIILPSKNLVLEDIQNFIESKEWYVERNIPYKRGYMFYGAPGNGKTTFCLSLARHFNRDLYMYTPNKDTSDSDLIDLFRLLSTKSILVVEDVDTIFTDRDSDDSVSFSFSTLLNCLDGALSKQDMIVIFTTNHPERLDPALIREGRIDVKIEIGNPCRESIQDYLVTFFGEDFMGMKAANEIIEFEQNETLSMVQVQNICLRHRLTPMDAAYEINQKLSEVK